MNDTTTAQTPTTGPVIPDFPTISDAQIEAAMVAAGEFGAIDLDFDGYDGWGFEQAVANVSSALRAASLFGPFSVYLDLDHDPGEGTTGGGQVMVAIPDGPVVASSYSDLRYLTTDREATGIAGLVAIAQVIVGDAENTVNRLRRWVFGAPIN